ncbi:unnamed protein product [Rhizophagus irregularis]|nr:unnamed protein product [Rhizophagus irregularis]
MTTPPVPSVLNPDITPPPRPIILAPSGNRFWPPSNDKGKAVAFDVPERRPSPDGNAAAIKSSPSRFHAAAYLHDVPAAFKEKFTTNRTMYDEVDRALFRYSSYGFRARCEGSGDNKRILVSFFVQEDHSTCVQSPCADLLDLVFTPYSPAEARCSDEESLCSLLTFLFSLMRHKLDKPFPVTDM